MIDKLLNSGPYCQLLHADESNQTILDKLCATLLALCPILQYYIGPFKNLGFSVLIAVMPWICFRILYRLLHDQISYKGIPVILGLIVFLVYRTFAHEISIINILFNLTLIVLYAGAIFGCINIRWFICTSMVVAAAASVLLVIQTASYYLLHYHIQLAPTKLFSSDAWAWIQLAKTGVIGVTQQAGTLYRPSAFFMEPSHMFLYTFPHLCLMLLSPNVDRMRILGAILLSVGLILCTSGMGIAVTAGVWGLFLLMSFGDQNQTWFKNLLNPKNILRVTIFLVAIIVICLVVPFLRESVLRVIDFSDYGAITARTRQSSKLLRTLKGKQLIFGVTNTIEGINFNMSGFAATLYKFGVIGVILSFWTYVFGVFHLKKSWFWISSLVVLVSFFSAHTHGTFYMIYYVFFIIEGWRCAHLSSE